MIYLNVFSAINEKFNKQHFTTYRACVNVVQNPRYLIFMMMCSLCPLGPFLLGWSHLTTFT